MVHHLSSPSEGFGRSPEQVFIETRGYGSARMTGYMLDTNRQVMEGVLFDESLINPDVIDTVVSFAEDDELEPVADSQLRQGVGSLAIGQSSTPGERIRWPDYNSTKLLAGPIHGPKQPKAKK